MAGQIICKLCEKRRAKRACPAVHGEICAICCGEQREVTLTCPLECEYLREAHKHEKAISVPAEQILHREVEIREEFLRDHEELLFFFLFSVVQASLRTPHAVDSDVMEALGAMIQTRRTAQSGLVYETRAENTVAAAVQQKFGESLNAYEQGWKEKESAPFPEGHVFKMLVFLHRMGQQTMNGRPKGRMFIDMLRGMVPDVRVDERAPSILL